MNAYIEKRKSVRKYKAELLDKEILDKIQCKIDNICRLILIKLCLTARLLILLQ